MSIQGNDGFLDLENASLRVTGNVHAEGLKVGSIRLQSAATLQSTTNSGNTTTQMVQFTNPTKGFDVTSNIEVGDANLYVDTTTGRVGIGTSEPRAVLDVRGNIEVGDANLFVDTTTSNVGIGTNAPLAKLHVNGLLKAPGVILNVQQFIDSVSRTSTSNTVKTIGYETPAINVKAGSKIKVDVYIPWRHDSGNSWSGGYHYLDFKVNKTVGTVSAGTYVMASDSGFTMVYEPSGAILQYTNSLYLPFLIQEDFTLHIRHSFMKYYTGTQTMHVNGSNRIDTEANLQQFFGNDFGNSLGYSHYIITEIAG